MFSSSCSASRAQGYVLAAIVVISHWLALAIPENEVNASRVFRAVNASSARRTQATWDVFDNWPWPDTTMLKFTSTATGTTEGDRSTPVTVLTGLQYYNIQIEAVGQSFGSDHAVPTVKLVNNRIGDRARCSSTANDAPVGIYNPTSDPKVYGNMGTMNGPYQLNVEDPDDGFSRGTTTEPANIMFMHGGEFRLCYTPDGTFPAGDQTEYKNNLVEVTIQALGVQGSCTTDGCMRELRWDCAFAYKGESMPDCVFNFRDDGGRAGWSIEAGVRSFMSWTKVWTADTISGDTVTTHPEECAASEPEGSLAGAEYFDTSTVGFRLLVDGNTLAVAPPVKATVKDGFTLTACYCPNYNHQQGGTCIADPQQGQCCDETQEFIQNFGVLYYWTVRICDYDNYETCDPPYMRVLPQQNFVIRVQCPPGGGCLQTNDNVLKFINYGIANDRPSWDSIQGCRNVDAPATAAVWSNEGRATGLYGGTSTLYKSWQNNPVKLNMALKQSLDLCYCNSEALVPSCWFKIASIRTTKDFALASKSSASSSLETIKYINWPGSVAMYGGITTTEDTVHPLDSNKYSGKALIKVVSFDRELVHGVGDDRRTLERHGSYDVRLPTTFQDEMNLECQRLPYSQDLWYSYLDSRQFMAVVDPNSATTPSRYLSFTGPDHTAEMRVRRAGVVALCYCAMVTAEDTCGESDWMFVSRLTVRGPRGGDNWVFPTGIAVMFSMSGWGMSNDDKLRIIAASDSCADNTFNPVGDENYKVGCPAISGAGCERASQSQLLTLQTTSSESSNIHIAEVVVMGVQTELVFTSSVQGVLKPGDIITIDMATILINGHAEGSMTDPEKYDAAKLSGIYPYADDASKNYMIGHKLIQVYDTNSQVDWMRMRIPVGWIDDLPNFPRPAFTLTSNLGRWTRRNNEMTQQAIKATAPQENLKVCWGVIDRGTTFFYAQAGTVSFRTPPSMHDVRASLTTKQRDAVAPVVISFMTDPARHEYDQTEGTTMLMLRFLDVSTSSGKLVPHFSGDISPTADPPIAVPDDTEITADDAQQWVCGKLFMELWSDHEEGFPLPMGCYYTLKYRDRPTVNDPTTFYREFYLLFRERTGLRPGVRYQMVINAQILDVSDGDPIVDIYSLCNDEARCERPWQGFEKGTATAYIGTCGDGHCPRTELKGRALVDPNWGDSGFVIERGDPLTTVLNLATLNILQLRLAGGAGEEAITRESLIRVYLWPLTAWDIGSQDCTALCEPYALSNARCDGNVMCKPEEIINGSGWHNVIKLRLPTDMDPITGEVTHTIRITGLTRPKQGFFPTRLGAQLTRTDDTMPVYTTSTGFLMKNPDVGQTIGQVVTDGRTGYGPRPFADDQNNILYVRLQFGATVWNNGNADSAILTLQLPTLYTCSVLDDGVPESSLQAFEQQPNLSRGVLAVSPLDGNWDNSIEHECIYKLRAGNAIFAGMVAYIKLTVQNPDIVMTKFHPDNVWNIKLSSMGMHTVLVDALDMPIAPFISLADESGYWESNAAVLNTIVEGNIQPADFSRSTSSRPTSQFLQVFFRTSTYVGQQGYIILDAPPGFDFGETCEVASLDPSYYAFIGISDPQLHELRNVVSCMGQQYPPAAAMAMQTGGYNRARIHVGGVINQVSYYGFAIKVTHPENYDHSTQHALWYLFTQDSNGYGLDGSVSALKFNLNKDSTQTDFYHLAWGMYNSRPEDVAPDTPCCTVTMSPTQPYSITNSYAQVIIGPFRFNVATDTSLRVTAPLGFIWDPSMASTFVPRPGGTAATFPATPVVDNSNELVWDFVSFAGATDFYFQANIRVPDHNPVISSNKFFIEVGFKSDILQERFFATAVTSQHVAALTNCAVSYSSNLVGAANDMEFRLQTVSPLTTDQGIVIKGDSNTRGFIFTCPPLTVLEGSAPIPDIFCVFPSTPDNLPALKIKVLNDPLPAGHYMFEVKATNPSAQALQGSWTFGTYNEVMEHPNMPPASHIDSEQVALGFTINGPIFEARMINEAYGLTPQQRIATRRDDRPGRENFLIFRLQLRTSPSSESILLLRGPRGFGFAEKCLNDIITDSNHVFGPNTLQEFANAGYRQWPPGATPVDCVGDGRFVSITLPAGLQRQEMYAFQIRVEHNPMSTPTSNTWTIDINRESSEPFQSFPIWTFTGPVQIAPVSQAKIQVGANAVRTPHPVTFTFVPFNSVPAAALGAATGGMLRLIAPEGFEFFEEPATQQCIADLFETSTSFSFSTSQMRCEVREKTRMHLTLTSLHGVEAGEEYKLTARVFNPPSTSQAQQWQMDSWAGAEAIPQDALDELMLTGYDVRNVLNRWIVRNTNNIQTGSTVVPGVEFTMAFPDPLQRDDEIDVIGPLNFFFQGDADLRTCNGFEYPGTNPLPNTDPPQCICDTERCIMRFIIQENSVPALLENVNIIFRVTMANPLKTPPLTDNYWKVEHRRNFQGEGWTVRSMDVAESWTVLPQLENLQILLVGDLLAASTASESTTSDIQFIFEAVSVGDTISITVDLPSEFDFGRAVVQNPISIQRNEGSNIVLERVPMQPGLETKFTISSVILGRSGGQTVWSLLTFVDPQMTQRLDQKLMFEGFILPGKASVMDIQLSSLYEQEQAVYPVKSLFPPRVDELAMVTVTLEFTQRVMAREVFIVECIGDYELQTAPFNIFSTGPVDHSIQRIGTRLEARLKPSAAITEVALQAHTPYSVIFAVVPKVGENMWRFETRNDGAYPTNTNDGTTNGFSPVEWMQFTASAPFRPPGAIIDVTFDVNQGAAVVRELTIIAPPRFIFPSTGCGNMCTPGQAFGQSNRRTAVIASPTGDPLVNLNQLVIKVQTPEATPPDFEWYIQGRGQGVGTTTGWGEFAGFRVTQMRGTEIRYAGVPSLQSGQMAFTFTLDRDAGNVIEVQAPPKYVLSCSLDGALKQMSLPGGRPQCTDDPLILQLTTTLTKGDYAFAIAADLPVDTPAGNTFNLIISDSAGVVDAAYNIPGKPIVPVSSNVDGPSQAWIRDPTLSWASAEAGKTTTVTVGVTFNGESNALMALLITCPAGFIHDVRRPTDVQNLNKAFSPALAPTPWADTTEPDRIMIRLDDMQDSVTIPAGTYHWSFPVMVPCCSDADMPRNNLWLLTLCSTRECRSESDRGVLLTFPLAGFNLGEEPPASLTAVANRAYTRRCAQEPALMWILLLLLMPISRAVF